MRHEMSHEGEDEPLRHLFECKRQEDSEPRAATKLSHLLPIHSSGR
jgi:hypothetical protein